MIYIGEREREREREREGGREGGREGERERSFLGVGRQFVIFATFNV